MKKKIFTRFPCAMLLTGLGLLLAQPLTGRGQDVGINFQDNNTGGEVVTAPAFGLDTTNWYNLAAGGTGNQSLTLPNGTSLSVAWSTYGTWYTSYADGNTGDDQVYYGWVEFDPVWNTAPTPGQYYVTISGLHNTFTNGYVIQTASADNSASSFQPVTVTGSSTQVLNYTALNYHSDSPLGGMSSVSTVINDDSVTLTVPQSAWTAPGGYLQAGTLAGIIFAGAPVIATPPQGAVNLQGAAVSLSVGALGPNLAYQWQLGGTNLIGATNATYAIASFSATNSGTYDVIITNSYGSVTSQGVVLKGLPANSGYPMVETNLSGLADYYRLGEGSATNVAHDSWGNNDGVYSDCIQGVFPGALALDDDGCTLFDSDGATNGSRVILNAAPFDYTASSQFSFVAWINLSTINGVERVVSNLHYAPGGTGWGFGIHGNAALRFTAFGVVDVDAPVGPALGGSGQTLQTNQWYQIAVTYNQSTVVVYLNGVPLATNTAAGILDNGVQPATLGGSPESTPGNDAGLEDFLGEIDEVAFFTNALSPQTLQTLFNANSGQPVKVTQQPASLRLLAGGTAQFSAAFSGSAPIYYQWWSNNVAISGATNVSLGISGVQTSWNTNRYFIVATNSGSSATSAVCTVTVTAPSLYASTIIQDSPASYWRLDDSGATATIEDEWASRNGVASGSVTYGTPAAMTGDPSLTALTFDGSTAEVNVPNYPALNTPQFTIECWAKVTGGQGNYRSPVTSRGGGSGYIFYAAAGEDWEFWIGNAGYTVLADPAKIVYGVWTHLVGTYDGTNLTFYVNGQSQTNLQTAFTPNTSAYPLRFGAGATEGPGAYFFPGSVDEVAYYNYALTAPQVQAHYFIGLFGSTNVAPIFQVQPGSQRVVTNTPATFTAVAAGNPAPTYQWYEAVGGVTNLIADATNTSYTTAPVQDSDTGEGFFVIASNQLNQVASTTALLTAGHLTKASGLLVADEFNGGAYANNVAALGALYPTAASLPTPSPVEYLTAFNDNADLSGDSGERISGWFTPPVSGNYVFFEASDDSSTLWLSTNSDPANVYQIAQNQAWMAAGDWTLSNTGTGEYSYLSTGEWRSDQFELGGGPNAFASFINGWAAWPTLNSDGSIPLVVGTKYYIELDHWQGNGGQNAAVTYKLAGSADPTTGAASLLTGNAISAVVPDNVVAEPHPVIAKFSISGTKVTMSGNNGLVNAMYNVLTSTNVAAPLSNWTVLTSARFDTNGNFSSTNTVNAASQRFYLLQVP